MAILIVASGLPEGRPEMSRWHLHWNQPYIRVRPAEAQGSPFLRIGDMELEILRMQKKHPAQFRRRSEGKSLPLGHYSQSLRGAPV